LAVTKGEREEDSSLSLSPKAVTKGEREEDSSLSRRGGGVLAKPDQPSIL